MTAPSICSSESSLASDSTIMTALGVPATTRSRSPSRICSWVGLRTYSPSIMPTRAPPIGPMNGTPERVSAAEAAGSREFFLIVDGQGEEVLAGLHRLGGGDGAQHHGFAEGREYRAVGLAGNAARFELEGFSAPLDFDSFRIEHWFSFSPGGRMPAGAA